MFLSKRSNGTWYIFYDTKEGKRTCISTKCKLKGDALKFLSDFRNEYEKRKESKLTSIKLNDFLNEYLKYSEVIHTPKTTHTVKACCKSVLNYFNNILITDLTYNHIDEYIQYRIKNPSPYTAKRELAYLNAMFKWGISKGFLLKNPAAGIKKPKLPEKQPLYFTKESFQVFLRYVNNNDFKDLFIFAVNTGLRQMELLTLEWNQINFKDNYLILNNRNHLTKSKKIRSVPLNITALQILTQREMDKKGDLVFTYNNKNINPEFASKYFKKCVRKSGLNPALKFHCLRHTFASWLVQKGVSIYFVSKLLGHADVSTTQIYAHLNNNDLRDSVELLN